MAAQSHAYTFGKPKLHFPLISISEAGQLHASCKIHHTCRIGIRDLKQQEFKRVSLSCACRQATQSVGPTRHARQGYLKVRSSLDSRSLPPLRSLAKACSKTDNSDNAHGMMGLALNCHVRLLLDTRQDGSKGFDKRQMVP